MPAKKESTTNQGGSRAWRNAALTFPETEASDSCNKTAFKARGKSFLFLGEDDANGSYDIKVKLGDSRAEAEKMAAANPDHISVGPHWIDAEFAQEEIPPAGLIERWLEESFCLTAPKTLIANWEG